MKNDVTMIGRRGHGKSELKYVFSYGFYDIFTAYGKYYVFDDSGIVYYARTVGRCKRWINNELARKEEYR